MLAGLTLAGCAKKHHTVAAPAPPRIVNGETGLASWYGHPYHGRPAADGEIYDMEKLTAAHRTLPFGTWVRVVNLTNDKTVNVRITDRGPFVENRIIDLSHAAAVAIGLIGPGVARVRLDILSVPTVAASENWYGVQAGAFLDPGRAERLRASLERTSVRLTWCSAPIVHRFGAWWSGGSPRWKQRLPWPTESARNPVPPL